MTLFIFRRVLQGGLVIFLMSLVVFVGIYQIGNPIDILINPEAPPHVRQQVIERLGLDQPLFTQYMRFLLGALQGDLGNSFVYNVPAFSLIAQALPATLELAFAGLFLAVVLGVPLGMWAGYRPDHWSSKAIMGISILGFSLPTFWVGLMMIVIFSVELRILPSGGRGETVSVLGIPFSFLTWNGLTHLLLPALNLALFKIGLVIRLVRASMQEVLKQDFIRFARAKGLPQRIVVGVHAFRNILLPLTTILGLEFGSLIAFAIVTETIFSWPGMGTLIIKSISVLDRPVIVAYLMLTALLFVLINLIVDITYSLLDPRVRLGEERE